MKHEHFWMICAATGAAFAVIAGAAEAARAEPAQAPITVIAGRSGENGMTALVSYRDLNLTMAHDARILNRRVGGATRKVCAPDDRQVGDNSYSECVSFAWSGARPQIALAVQRAREIAATGSSAIPLVAISISVR